MVLAESGEGRWSKTGRGSQQCWQVQGRWFGCLLMLLYDRSQCGLFASSLGENMSHCTALPMDAAKWKLCSCGLIWIKVITAQEV